MPATVCQIRASIQRLIISPDKWCSPTPSLLVSANRSIFRGKISNFSHSAWLCSKLSPEEMEKRRREMMAKNLPKRKPIDGVKNVVLVSSAKGGVGKSTIAGSGNMSAA